MTVGPLRVAWLDDGLVGHASQAWGLAEAIARERPTDILRTLVAPQWLNRSAAAAPDCDILIACGRAATPTARRAAKSTGSRPFVVHIQDPRRGRRDFDVVVAPRHDRLKGDNVIAVIGGPHRIRADDCIADAELLRSSVAFSSKPHCAFLFGGATKRAPLRSSTLKAWIHAALAVRKAGYALLVTPSRRTGEDTIEALHGALTGPDTLIWDGDLLGVLPNPYRGFLGLAEHIVVTSDSVTMAVEAAATGKPLHILDGPDDRSKFRHLRDDLIAHGAARAFRDPPWESWRYPPLDETTRAAHEVLRRYDVWARLAA